MHIAASSLPQYSCFQDIVRQPLALRSRVASRVADDQALIIDCMQTVSQSTVKDNGKFVLHSCMTPKGELLLADRMLGAQAVEILGTKAQKRDLAHKGRCWSHSLDSAQILKLSVEMSVLLPHGFMKSFCSPFHPLDYC